METEVGDEGLRKSRCNLTFKKVLKANINSLFDY